MNTELGESKTSCPQENTQNSHMKSNVKNYDHNINM